MNRLIIWGAGELGGRVARLWCEAGGEVIACTKTTQKHSLLHEIGTRPTLENPLQFITHDDMLLLSLPGHQRQGEAIKQLIAQQITVPQRVVLISLTGVYSAATGIVDENSAIDNNERAKSIAAVEQLFLQWSGKGGVVLRLGGLYCAQRGPFSALARRGKVSRLAPANKIMALIHYEDAATAAAAALRHPAPEQHYVGVTVPCPTRQEFYSMACPKLQIPEPDYAPPLNKPPVIYDISRLRRDLLPSPAYADWRMAIALSDEKSSSR